MEDSLWFDHEIFMEKNRVIGEYLLTARGTGEYRILKRVPGGVYVEIERGCKVDLGGIHTAQMEADRRFSELIETDVC